MSLDYYTKHLLGMAVESCEEHFYMDCPPRGVSLSVTSGIAGGATLAEALTALLTDLGETVPERPSVEDAERMMGRPLWKIDIEDLRDLYAREPLTVLALLEGGES